MASNTLLTISMITGKAAAILSNSLQLAKCVDRSYDSEFQVKGAQIGLTVNVRKPPRYNIRDGEVVDIQAATETYAPLTFTTPYGVDIAFTSTERSFSIDDFTTRFLKAAAVRSANETDKRGYDLLNQVWEIQGTPGTALTASTARGAVSDAIARLYDNDSPIGDGDIHEMNSSQFNSTLSQSAAALFNPQTEVSDIFVRGQMGEYGGAMHYVTQQVPSFKNGTYGGSPIVATTTSSGSSLDTSGWTATSTTLPVGTAFTVAGVNGVNPQTKVAYSWLQKFVVTEATVTDGGGLSTIKISPAIVTSGPFQNVSRAPTANDVITVVTGATGTSHDQSVVFHRNAFMLANKELDLPPNVEASYVADSQSGIGLRIATQWDVRTNQLVTRLDTMTAWAVLYPQLAARIFTT